MAVIQMTLLSQCLMRTVPVTVILPADKMLYPGMKAREDRPYRTLYLLHGVLGSTTDWLNGTRIARYAEENDLAVVMPSGDNMFYVDQEKGHNYYGEFIGRELVELTRRIFPLSHKREETFIGGLSMGGFGALRNGLKYHETFGSIVALSSALISDECLTYDNDCPIFFRTHDYAEAVFGDLQEISGSDKDPKALARKLAEEGKQIPDIYMACGESDSLLGVNNDMAAFLKELKMNIHYIVAPGDHEWDFWDTWMKDAIYNWLPVEKNGLGVNSGNVGI